MLTAALFDSLPRFSRDIVLVVHGYASTLKPSGSWITISENAPDFWCCRDDGVLWACDITDNNKLKYRSAQISGSIGNMPRMQHWSRMEGNGQFTGCLCGWAFDELTFMVHLFDFPSNEQSGMPRSFVSCTFDLGFTTGTELLAQLTKTGDRMFLSEDRQAPGRLYLWRLEAYGENLKFLELERKPPAETQVTPIWKPASESKYASICKPFCGASEWSMYSEFKDFFESNDVAVWNHQCMGTTDFGGADVPLSQKERCLCMRKKLQIEVHVNGVLEHTLDLPKHNEVRRLSLIRCGASRNVWIIYGGQAMYCDWS